MSPGRQTSSSGEGSVAEPCVKPLTGSHVDPLRLREVVSQGSRTPCSSQTSWWPTNVRYFTGYLRNVRHRQFWKQERFKTCRRSGGEGTSPLVAILVWEWVEAEAILMVIARRLLGCCSGSTRWWRRRAAVDVNERLEARVASSSVAEPESTELVAPPSQDPPLVPPRPGGKASVRKRGGQHGHEGKYGWLLPPERVHDSSSTGPSGAGRVRTSSSRGSASTGSSLLGVRSRSRRPSRSG